MNKIKKIAIILMSTILINMGGINPVQAKQPAKHHISEVVAYVQGSTYNKITKLYSCNFVDEDGDIFAVNCKESNNKKWFVMLVDDHATQTKLDDEIINVYEYDNYTF